ncbi:MAG: DEAD/DEAH box helicase [Candidatus Andersenbacteria bacterium]|nr:DEAD/DEAH box helicase [Candidatus Andersenbacteria bacterium]
MSHNIEENTGFAGLGLLPKLLAVVARLGFTVPTPIQQAAIPVAVQGKDVIGVAQTGTGKTLAFALPLLQRLAAVKRLGLIILPTRELAVQVDEVLHQVGGPFGVRRALLIGGASLAVQVKQLRQRPHVVIGTPGRIIDHLEQKNLTLHAVGVLVLDEADRMLDMGFAPQIARILQRVPRDRQTMLFSATMPPAIVKMAAQYLRRPVRVEVARTGTVAARVNQELFVIKHEHKVRLLHKLLGEYAGTVLVFSRTKYGAKKLCRTVRGMGHEAAEIHSNLTLAQRRRSLEGFKSGTYRVLVATDIAARGIDVQNVALVINYDLPDHLEEYVHRVGRTGRAGREGQAISFVTPEQRGKVRLLERLVRTQLKVSPLPVLPADNWLTVPARRVRRERARPHAVGRATSQTARSSDRVRLHI